MAPLLDQRLIGTWQSDRWKTMRHFKFRPSTTTKNRRLFSGLFGKLRVRYGPRRYRWWFEGDDPASRPQPLPYEVVAMDGDSVVIRTKDFFSGQPKLQQLHFEGDRYWLAVHGGTLVEWFRKVLD